MSGVIGVVLAGAVIDDNEALFVINKLNTLFKDDKSNEAIDPALLTSKLNGFVKSEV